MDCLRDLEESGTIRRRKATYQKSMNSIIIIFDLTIT